MKYFLLFLSILNFTACSQRNDQYYMQHPHALQSIIAQCSRDNISSERCQEHISLARRMNSLAEALRMDPQAFGKQILELQTEIAQQTSTANPDKKRLLAERLAIIRWLESPGR